MSDLSKEDLYTHMEMAMASYVSLYTRVMLRELGIDESYESDVPDRKKMALQLVEPLNHASYAAWCAVMRDKDGVDQAMEELKQAIDAIPIPIE